MNINIERFIPISLFLIIFIAGLLRLWQIGNVPPSPDWDEAALGYNAYSILNTGRDEYGKFLPLVLRSFDDYKPGLYAYFIIPFLYIFGLTLSVVRLPSVIFGLISIFVLYFLVKEILNNNGFINEKIVGLLSSFMLAISPWHIQFSRIAFESNVGMAFNLLGVFTFLKGLKSPIYLIASVFFFASNVYVYQSNKVFSPLLLLLLIIIYFRTIINISRKYLILAVVFGVIISTPLIISTLTDSSTLSRARGVAVFADQTQFLKRNVQRIIQDAKNNDRIGLILDNRRYQYLQAIISGYISHFDLNWLLISGDLPRHHAPFMGLLYIWELPFVLVGLYVIIFGKFTKKIKLFLIGWYLIVPIPASITSGVPHSIRTLNFLPLYPIFTAIGLVYSYYFLQKKYSILLQKIIIIGFIFFAGFQFLYFINQYFIQLNYYTSQEWQYGYSEAVDYVKKHEGEYKKIVVTNKPPLDQSYMFFLFYLQYSPVDYQRESQLSSGGFRENHVFGKYIFRPIDWNSEEKAKKTLYVGRPGDFSEDANILKTVNYLDGKPAIKIVEGK